MSYEKSKEITERITHGDMSQKPGWIRLSLHPSMTDAELDFTLDAIRQISVHHAEWGCDYVYNKHTNEFIHAQEGQIKNNLVSSWFKFEVTN